MKYSHFFIIAFVLVSLPAHAQIAIGKGGNKTTIDLSPVQLSMDAAAREFMTVLQADLARSGWFDRGPAGASEISVTGQVQSDGVTLRANLRAGQASLRRVFLEKSYSTPHNGIRRLAHEVADEIVKAVTGKRGFASARLLMLGTRTKSKELYMCDSDGRGLYPLTNDKKLSMAPRWGHDNRSIFYTSYLTGFPAIFRVDLESRKRERVANFSGLNASAAVSPDGRDLALILSRDGNPELYVMRLSDKNLTRITNTPRATEASPSWSPDGRQIVYVSDAPGTPHLYIVSRSGGAPVQLTKRGRQNVSPDWGPGGEIAYASNVGGKFQVSIINPQTGAIVPQTSDLADHEDPSWAPNGRHLAIAKSVGYKSRVYLIDTKGDPPILLTDYEGDWYSPKWSR